VSHRPPRVTARGLRIGYRGQSLLPAFDVELAAGEVVLVVGRNGSGKTTFVRTMLGLLSALAGTIERGRDVRPAFVPQASTIDAFVPLRVRDVVDYGRVRGWSFVRPWPGRGDRQHTTDALAVMGLTELARRRFGELSGGQQQRVLIARVLAGGADLVALDEPTAAMDAANERATYEQLRRLALEQGLCLLVVTHAVAIAAPYADRIALFDPDDRGSGELGRVVIDATHAVVGDARFQRVFGRIELGVDSAVSS
jgi:zinc transport system ATP-binding protein